MTHSSGLPKSIQWHWGWSLGAIDRMIDALVTFVTQVSLGGDIISLMSWVWRWRCLLWQIDRRAMESIKRIYPWIELSSLPLNYYVLGISDLCTSFWCLVVFARERKMKLLLSCQSSVSSDSIHPVCRLGPKKMVIIVVKSKQLDWYIWFIRDYHSESSCQMTCRPTHVILSLFMFIHGAIGISIDLGVNTFFFIIACDSFNAVIHHH